MKTVHTVMALLLTAPLLQAADVQSQDLKAGKDDDKRYFLITPANLKPPAAGHPLLLILPGGDGSAEMNPFCQRVAAQALPPDFIAAQLVAKHWTESPPIIWPTATNPAKGQKFTTEEFIEAIIADVNARHKIDPKRIYALAWSSGGPAAYAATLKKTSPLRGAFVAMSVFKPNELPPLDAAKGKSFYIYHSPEDRTCPFRMAVDAEKQLTVKGAKATLVKYPGGHAWRGPVYDNIRAGIDWLEKQQ